MSVKHYRGLDIISVIKGKNVYAAILNKTKTKLLIITQNEIIDIPNDIEFVKKYVCGIECNYFKDKYTKIGDYYSFENDFAEIEMGYNYYPFVALNVNKIAHFEEHISSRVAKSSVVMNKMAELESNAQLDL